MALPSPGTMPGRRRFWRVCIMTVSHGAPFPRGGAPSCAGPPVHDMDGPVGRHVVRCLGRLPPSFLPPDQVRGFRAADTGPTPIRCSLGCCAYGSLAMDGALPSSGPVPLNGRQLLFQGQYQARAVDAGSCSGNSARAGVLMHNQYFDEARLPAEQAAGPLSRL